MFVSVRCEQLQPTPTTACQLQLDGSVWFSFYSFPNPCDWNKMNHSCVVSLAQGAQCANARVQYHLISMKYFECFDGSLLLFPCNAEVSTALSWHKLLSMLPWRVTRDSLSARSINMHLGLIGIWWWWCCNSIWGRLSGIAWIISRSSWKTMMALTIAIFNCIELDWYECQATSSYHP